MNNLTESQRAKAQLFLKNGGVPSTTNNNTKIKFHRGLQEEFKRNHERGNE